MTLIKIGILGYAGRMGQAVLKSLYEDPHAQFIGGSVSPSSHDIDALFPEDIFNSADVLIDFSTVESCLSHVKLAADRGKPLVVGVTGFSEEQLSIIEESSKRAPIFLAYNMSIGISILKILIEKASLLLDESYDMALIETHHRYKKDAPSGTAIMLTQDIQRPIDMQSIRGGTVTGDHRIEFLGNHETIVLQHTAQDRRIFADGAIKAAKWLLSQEPGFYGMKDLLKGKI
jgi:4-hydroxy-tetrahydrodipicolinate reductase